MSYFVDEHGYYGKFGGAYIPEMLYPNVEELRQNYLKIMQVNWLSHCRRTSTFQNKKLKTVVP